MNIKQRLCGFIGHKSKLLWATSSGRVSHVKLRCSRCKFATKWFEISGIAKTELSHVDVKMMNLSGDSND